MHTGLVIYTGNLAAAADFYSYVFDLETRESDGNYVALESGAFELVLLETVESSGIELPTSAKAGTPVKPVFLWTFPFRKPEKESNESAEGVTGVRRNGHSIIWWFVTVSISKAMCFKFDPGNPGNKGVTNGRGYCRYCLLHSL